MGSSAATTAPQSRAQKTLHWVLTGALTLTFAAELAVPQRLPLLDATLLILAVCVSITALNRLIPLQNILLAAAITAVLGTLAHGLSAYSGVAMPFGPIIFHETAGTKIFNLVPWTIPLLWVVALFNSRGTARLMLRPWRKLKSYGYWVIALTTVLMVAFDFALEPFAAHANHFWLWQPTKISLTWYDASPLNFIGWAVVSLLILGFATPTLIKKQPGSRSAMDLNPFGIWLGAIILFTVGAAKAVLWPAVGVDAAIAIVTLVFAIRGARW